MAAPVVQPPVPGLTAGETGTVHTVASGDTVSLESGLTVRLAGVEAPAVAADGPAWPLAEIARETTRSLLAERRVILLYAEDRRDRWRRAIAHLVRLPDHLWAQGHLLDAGLVRVRTTRSTASGANRLLALERTARSNRLGIWADRFYRIRNPGETWEDLDSFQIVEGRVADAAEVRGTIYLNFGTDWRRDFTFRIQRDARRRFRRYVDVPSDLTGRAVRGRGWVFLRNGPMIDLTHPEQLELLAS